MTDCDIRLLTTLPEMEAVVALQRRYWGDEPEAVIPAHMLHTLARHGGHVLAAVERDHGRPVAMLAGLAGIASGGEAAARPYLVSKRMVVHEDWRRRGLARRLKLAQRERALAQGIDLVRWTFDPLLAANAWMNLHRLGAVATGYCEDFFGAAGPGGEANAGSPDRLLVDWSLESERVRALAGGAPEQSTPTGALAGGAVRMYDTSRAACGRPAPSGPASVPDADQLLLEIPLDFVSLARQDTRLAQVWRTHIRSAMNALFAAGHVLHDCVRGRLDGQDRMYYLSAASGSGA